jgi:hypothetical protein
MIAVEPFKSSLVNLFRKQIVRGLCCKVILGNLFEKHYFCLKDDFE